MSEPKHPHVHAAILDVMRDMAIKTEEAYAAARTSYLRTNRDQKAILKAHADACQPWIALLKQVENGSVSPMDAYDYCKLGVIPGVHV